MIGRIGDLLILLLGFGVMWHLLHLLVGSYGLSSPLQTLAFAWELLFQDTFWRHVRASGLALLYALFFALVGGLLIGLTIGLSRLASDVADPILIALFSLPKITLYPIILLIFGLGISAKVAFGALHGIFPVVIFTLMGIRNIKPIMRRSARSMNLTPTQTILTVLLPAALPEIVTGLRIGLAATILGTLIGEMFASTEGIGFMLIRAIDVNNVLLIMSLTLILFAISATANAILLVFERRVHGRRVAAVAGH